MDEQGKKSNKELQNIKKNQMELKNTITGKHKTRRNQEYITWYRETDKWTERQNNRIIIVHLSWTEKKEFKKWG